MKLRFVTMDPADLSLIDLRADIAEACPALTDPAFAAALAGGYALTAIDGCRTVAAGGVMPYWPGCGRAWLAPGNGLRRRYWPAITEATIAVFARAHADGMARIETVVREDMPANHFWARRLGFESEGLMRRWGPEGKDYRLYARIDPAAAATEEAV